MRRFHLRVPQRQWGPLSYKLQPAREAFIDRSDPETTRAGGKRPEGSPAGHLVDVVTRRPQSSECREGLGRPPRTRLPREGTSDERPGIGLRRAS